MRIPVQLGLVITPLLIVFAQGMTSAPQANARLRFDVVSIKPPAPEMNGRAHKPSRVEARIRVM